MTHITPAGALTGRRTTWSDARTTELTEATCLWQDLDGLHLAPPPATPPHTSILWAWTPTGTLLRLRIDDNTVHLAQWEGAGDVETVPWSADQTVDEQDRRVASYRGSNTSDGGLGSTYTEITVHPNDPADNHGPITFIRPTNPTPPAQAR
jgi:hypothetical protein